MVTEVGKLWGKKTNLGHLKEIWLYLERCSLEFKGFGFTDSAFSLSTSAHETLHTSER